MSELAERFTSHLRQLAERDRGALAVLRRSLTFAPGTNPAAYPYVERFVPGDTIKMRCASPYTWSPACTPDTPSTKAESRWPAASASSCWSVRARASRSASSPSSPLMPRGSPTRSDRLCPCCLPMGAQSTTQPLSMT